MSRAPGSADRLNRQRVLDLCHACAGAGLDYPFGEDTAVFKVGGKMFALVALGEQPGSVTLKCDPEEAVALRAQYDCVTPGYYMNKKHWVTVDLAGPLPAGELADLVRGSYELVVAALPARLRPAR